MLADSQTARCAIFTAKAPKLGMTGKTIRCGPGKRRAVEDFGSPVRSVTFRVERPTMTDASSPSVNLFYFSPKQAMPGCSTAPINSPHDWPALTTPNRFLSKKNDTTFTIDWKGHTYRIEGPAFVFLDRIMAGTPPFLDPRRKGSLR
jgi:hypothetical protein